MLGALPTGTQPSRLLGRPALVSSVYGSSSYGGPACKSQELAQVSLCYVQPMTQHQCSNFSSAHCPAWALTFAIANRPTILSAHLPEDVQAVVQCCSPQQRVTLAKPKSYGRTSQSASRRVCGTAPHSSTLMLAGFFSWMSSALACQPPGRAVPNALRNSGTPAASSAASSLCSGNSCP